MGTDRPAPELRTRALEGAGRAHEALQRDAEDLAAFSPEGHDLAQAAADAVAKLAAVLQRGGSNTSSGEPKSP